MNHFVPNFGRDKDINVNFNSLDWAEKNVGDKWVVDFKAMKAKGPPKDYPVPNFGVDEDVKMTQAHIAEQEKKLKHAWKPVKDENGMYVVPEANKNSSYTYKSLLQTDADIKLESDPICSTAGCNYAKDKGKTPYPMDYFVPNFGRDKDINVNFNSLDWAEKNVGHKWVVDFKAMKAKGPPKNYPVPNFGRDADINSTWASLDWAENDLSHKFNPMSKKEAKKLAHPVDYKVADFGLDEDVVITQKNIADQEKLKKHKWKPKQDENGAWVVPEAADNDSYSYSSLVQTDAEMGLEKKHKKHHRHHHRETSDPICSSAGWPCNKKAKSAHPVDYKVPNFGVDEDIIRTQKHMNDAEKKLGHKWKPVQDENGVW